MNEAKCNSFYQADRIIHEQELGIKWTPPKEDLFRNVDPTYFQDLADNDSREIEDARHAFENNLEEKLASSNVNSDIDRKKSLATKFQDTNKHSKTMKKTLELLCNEARFLVSQ